MHPLQVCGAPSKKMSQSGFEKSNTIENPEDGNRPNGKHEDLLMLDLLF